MNPPRPPAAWLRFLGLNLMVWTALAAMTLLLQGWLGRSDALHLIAMFAGAGFTGVYLLDAILDGHA
jgi:hypothetical protein